MIKLMEAGEKTGSLDKSMQDISEYFDYQVTNTLKTLTAVSLLAFFAEALPHWLGIATLATPFAAAMGGLLAGAGMLMLFRHRASLGGFNVLVLYLQERYGLQRDAYAFAALASGLGGVAS